MQTLHFSLVTILVAPSLSITHFLQHSYGVFVALLTVNWEFFGNIAAAFFEVCSAASTAGSLVATVYAFLFVTIAGAIIVTWILCHTPGIY